MLIGNLENLFDQFGFTIPHRIWLKLSPTATTNCVKKAMLATLQTSASDLQDTRLDINKEQSKMERVGIFGTLSMGFLATALMAMMGLLIYSYASLRERVYHLAHAAGSGGVAQPGHRPGGAGIHLPLAVWRNRRRGHWHCGLKPVCAVLPLHRRTGRHPAAAAHPHHRLARHWHPDPDLHPDHRRR